MKYDNLNWFLSKYCLYISRFKLDNYKYLESMMSVGDKVKLISVNKYINSLPDLNDVGYSDSGELC